MISLLSRPMFLSLLALVFLTDATQSSAQEQTKPAGGSSQKTFSATKTSDATLFGGFYGNLELRHHLNTYYDEDGYLTRREPSAHARMTLGTRLYDNLVDAFVTLGAYKVPETQQISQRRPEAEIDIYPVNNEYFTLQIYTILQAPFNSGDQAPADRDPDDRLDSGSVSEGTAVSIGLTPMAKYGFNTGGSKITFKVGADGWTKNYSRRQYTTVRPDEDDRERLGLAPNDTGEQEIEDYAQHYGTEAMGGIGFWTSALPALSADLGAFSTTKYTPEYELGEDSVSYTYAKERTSHYRMRLQYQWSSRISVVNDFYRFYDGEFGRLATGEQRRFRNIARITCKL